MKNQCPHISLLLSIFLLFLICPAHAVHGTLQIKSLSMQDGLSHSNVQCIVQDKYGFMWFGTTSGLNRYDGYHFKTYYPSESSDNSSLSSNIRSLFQDREGQLWVGTSKGLCLYDPVSDAFITHLSENASSLGQFDIANISQDDDGILWLSAYRTGILRYNPSTGTYKRYMHNNEDQQSLSSNTVFSIFEDSKDQIWITTYDQGVNLFNPSEETFTRFTHDPEDPHSLLGNNVHTMAEDPDGILWFACNYAGLSSIPIDEISNGKFTHHIHSPDPNSPASKNTRIICLDRKGGIWIGAENGLLDYYREGIFYHFDITDENSSSPGTGIFNALYVDKRNNLWIGSSYGGVYLVRFSSEAFTTYQADQANGQGLSHNSVWEFAEDRENYIWIATDGGGLNRFNPRTDEFTVYTSKNSNLANDDVLTVMVDTDNNVWIGSWLGGLSMLDRQTGNFINYNTKNSGISCDNIFDIAEDVEGNLWIATQNGLNKFDRKNQRFEIFTTKNSELPYDHMEVVESDLRGNILIGTVQGLALFNPQRNEWRIFRQNAEDEDALSDDIITSIFVEDSLTIWICTHYGLNKFNPVTGIFSHQHRKDGLPSNIINGIEKDKFGIYWISTNLGLVRFDEKKNSYRVFGPADGLQDYIFWKKSHLLASDGKLYYGGINGFSIIEPEKIEARQMSYPIVFTELLINNKVIQPHDETGILSQMLFRTKEIELIHKYQNFTIGFAALDYANSENIQYAYKLEGYDNNWNYIGKLRTATYTNLGEGTYVLKVKSLLNSEESEDNIISMTITILPPWWKTLAFRIILILVILALAISLYFVRVRTLQKQKQDLEDKVKLATRELKKSNTELRNEQEKLKEANFQLAENQHEILTQKEEIENHRNHLEKLVEERTSELLAAKQKAEESDKLKTAFLANLSHEIRTPMNAIVGFASLLDTPDLSEEEKKTFTEMINNNCDALTMLINDIIDISLIESKQLKLMQSPFNVHLVLEELLTFYQSINTKEIQLILENKENRKELVIENDPGRFKQIFSNLISNAFKYTEKGSIRFGYQTGDEEIRFYVADTGIGIREEDLRTIFNQFQKVESSDGKLYRGVGIGLTISSRLVQLMGGTIWVNSAPGKGSTFFFTLPNKIREEKQHKKHKNDRNQMDLKGYTILIAEDDSTNYMLVEKFLAGTRADIVWAKNGKEATEMVGGVKDFKKLIILMDIKMPVMNGIEALRIIRQKHKDVPIIAVTAYAQERDRLEILKNNFNGYVTKPILRQLLMDTIWKVLPENE